MSASTARGPGGRRRVTPQLFAALFTALLAGALTPSCDTGGSDHFFTTEPSNYTTVQLFVTNATRATITAWVIDIPVGSSERITTHYSTEWMPFSTHTFDISREGLALARVTYRILR
ncbi:MAG: hypothetical protein ACM3OB_00575, partial [Acidobacteriota bacterium]